jgi:hypothetical protein
MLRDAWASALSCRNRAAIRLRQLLYRYLLASLQPHASLAAVIVPGSRLLGSTMSTGNLAQMSVESDFGGH